MIGAELLFSQKIVANAGIFGGPTDGRRIAWGVTTSLRSSPIVVVRAAGVEDAQAREGLQTIDDIWKTSAISGRGAVGRQKSAEIELMNPTKGLNWGVPHPQNAVDIANKCGTPVYAAAEGLVIFDEDFGSGASGWNGGYGIFLLVEHPSGVRTRYAHLKTAAIAVGDHVERGDYIGTMGSTGNVRGETGCHLHFEVLGAKNPFLK